MTLHGLHHPSTLADALALLAQQSDAKPLAGGATLVAMMNAGVAEPPALVSLARIDELKGITPMPDGRIRIGAFTRHRDVAQCALALGAADVVRQAASKIGNASVRNMGTIGGSIAHADPGADYPAALVAAGAEIEIAAANARRTLPAARFFVDWYATALAPGELVSAVLLPKPDGGHGVYLKHVRVAGDFATASVALALRADGHLRVAVGACGPTPLADDAADALLSRDRSAAAVARAGAVLQQRADPIDDVRGSADYRRALIPRLLARAMHAVQPDAGGGRP